MLPEVHSIINDSVAEDDVIDCQIGIDGSWQKCGHASLNGVVTAVARDNKKVVDYKVLSKFCRGCATWEKSKGTDRYDKWKAEHICQVNHINNH